MFVSPAAKPWCRPLASASSEISVIAGAKQSPAPSEVRSSARDHGAEQPVAAAKTTIATAQIASPST